MLPRMIQRRGGLLAMSALALLSLNLSAQEGYTPSAENLKAREWFQDARFGLFIHWGVYSVRGEGEWVMQNTRMTVPEYERDLPPFFNPVKFDAAAWVATAKAAGMRYITITSKHHDGFDMFDSKVSDWDIVDRTPYAKDVLKQLAEECRKQGLKLFFYYSQLDWHHPDYFPRGRTGLFAGRAETGDFNRYLDYMDAQLKELLTGYGPLGGIWFDGMWDKPQADWRLGRTYKMIHDLQPQALIGSNHHLTPFPGEDIQIIEKDLPGGTTQTFNEKLEIGKLPLEMCDTINNSWGYNKTDTRKKGAKNLLQLLIRAAGHDSNLLLNIGPKPDGTLPEEHVAYLKEMGAWLQKNGETIYGTRGGPIQPRPWGVTTRKGDQVFVHVLDWKDAVLSLPRPDRTVKSAAYFKDGKAVPFTLEKDALSLRLDPAGFDPIDTIVVLQLGQ
jgi:alpha-L-fucosidase